jgi:hypothetical protein
VVTAAIFSGPIFMVRKERGGVGNNNGLKCQARCV